MNRVPELDGLRGTAIMLVIGCHYEVFARQFWELPKFGWVGVDLFFVLSGFLITTVLLNLRGQPEAFRSFYARRIRRILPPYVAFLALLYIVTAALGDYALYHRGTIVRSALFLQSFASISDTAKMVMSGKTLSLAHTHLAPTLRGMFGPVSGGWAVLWSLSIEEYYYLLWAPVVLWMSRKNAAITGTVICVLTLAIRWLGPTEAAGFSIYHRFDAPVFGSLTAFLIASRLDRRTVTMILTVAGVAGAALLAAILVPMGNVLGKEIRDDHIFVVFGFPAMSLLAAAVVGICVVKSGSRLSSALRSRVLRFMGKISYTLYLLHGFVYLCFLHVFAPTWVVTLASLFCAVTMSWISWTYFEQPILQGGRQYRSEARTKLKLASAA